MGKKRSREIDTGSKPETTGTGEVENEGSDFEDFEMLDVEFEWFNFNADIDFKGVRALIHQLFDVDHELIDSSGLADAIVAQNTIGSAVKVDSSENDPFCFLTVVNPQEPKDNTAIKSLISYLSEISKTNSELAMVPEVLEKNHVGILLSERVINMPIEVSPALYSMLIDELASAVEDKEPWDFSHFLVVTKVYYEVESTLEQDQPKQKKPKSDGSMCYFHPEDEVTRRFAVASGSYSFTGEAKVSTDSKRAFQEMGVKPMGFMMLLEATKLQEVAKAIAEFVGSKS